MIEVWEIEADREAARRFLRKLLGVDESHFTRGAYGKPALDGIQFNMSHSGGVALIALAKDRHVGIDIERHRDDIDIELVGRRFLGLTGVVTPAAFYGAWTRREAAVKAHGSSILLPGGPPDWRVIDLPADEGFSAALCYSGPEAEVISRGLTGTLRFRRKFQAS